MSPKSVTGSTTPNRPNTNTNPTPSQKEKKRRLSEYETTVLKYLNGKAKKLPWKGNDPMLESFITEKGVHCVTLLLPANAIHSIQDREIDIYFKTRGSDIAVCKKGSGFNGFGKLSYRGQYSDLLTHLRNFSQEQNRQEIRELSS